MSFHGFAPVEGSKITPEPATAGAADPIGSAGRLVEVWRQGSQRLSELLPWWVLIMASKTLIITILLIACLFVISVGAAAQTPEDKSGVKSACPTISILAPAGVNFPGEPLTFVARITGTDAAGAAYNWTISTGKIIRGQGTPTLEVETTRQMLGWSITATVEVTDPTWDSKCYRTASETAKIAEPEPTHQLLAELRTAGNTCEEGMAMIDSLMLALSANPNAMGVIIIYQDAGGYSAARTRKKQLTNYLRMRRYDASRITFVDGPTMKGAKTQFWIVPPGTTPPEVMPGDGSPPPSRPRPSDPRKPYVFGADHSDGLPECSADDYDVAEYAAALRAEPKARGRVVISEISAANFLAIKRRIRGELKTNGVPLSRVKITFKHVRPGRALESTELWIVPGKR